MSETRKFSDLLKAVASFSDMSGKDILMKDTSGTLGAAAISSLMPISIGRAINLANALPSTGLYLCVLYSDSNRFINCVFVVVYVKNDAVNNVSPHYIIGSQGGLTVTGTNAYGTIAVKMTSGTLPTDLRLLYIGVKT